MADSTPKRPVTHTRLSSPTNYFPIVLVLCLATLIALFRANSPTKRLGDVKLHTIHPVQSPSTRFANEQLSPRHQSEKVHLNARMRRDHGVWGTSHPRYRLLEALFSYSRYRERNMAELQRWRTLYKSVSKKQKQALESVVGYEKKLGDIEALISSNQKVCDEIVAHALEFYGIEREELDNHIREAEKNKRLADKVSVGQALKHFVRDWADEGAHERDDAFPCILSALSGLQPMNSKSKDPVRVLLPGSGLGRLAHEIARLDGYEVTINEWSMYMNIAYRYLASRAAINSIAFHPFIDSLSHHLTTQDLLRSVQAPEVQPNSSVLLVEGDFTTAFSKQPADCDVIVTHFFIDTARNVMSYFDTIHRLLKPGGHWINFGPLLWGTAPFVQLSLDEIVAVVESMGFEFLELDEQCGDVSLEGKRVRWKTAEYGFNGKALTRNVYKAQAWAVRKVDR